jgi:putative DNA primase/helicase
LVRLTDQLDPNPMLLGTPGGTVDLTTGELRVSDPGDLITQCTAVTPAPQGVDCPRWKQFLRTTFPMVPGQPEPDQAMIDFIQRYQGYSLTGDTREQRFAFLIGGGRNGKGVVTETPLGILGDYATVLPPEALMERTNEPHRAELAVLRGKRFVLTSEVSKSHKWNQGRLMALSAGDKITANLMRQNPVTFRFTGKLWIAANSAPKFSSANTAASERMMLIRHRMRFLHRDEFPEDAAKDPTIAERDNNLMADVRAEWPAIFRWLIEGCLSWQWGGLDVPKDVIVASRALVSDSDPLLDWITECSIVGDGSAFSRLKDLFQSWNIWRVEQGEKSTARSYFTDLLKEQGYQIIRAGFGMKVMGLKLNDIAAQRLMRARNEQDERYADGAAS